MHRFLILGGLFTVIAFIGAVIVFATQIPDVSHQLSPNATRVIVNVTTPLNDTAIPISQTTSVHADVLSTVPVIALELWVDGNLFSTQSTPGPDRTYWSTFWSWTPSGAGAHILLVRALDAGKRAVYSNPVNVTASADANISVAANFKTRQGDQLADVARQVGATPQQIIDLNPQLDPNNPIAPGDIISVPMPISPENTGGSNPNPPGPANPAPPSPPQNPPSPPNSPSNLGFWLEQNVLSHLAVQNLPFAPSIVGSVQGCDVQLRYYLEFTDPQVDGFFVYRLDPGSSQFKRIATLGAPPAAGWYSYSDSNVGGMLLYYLSSFNAAGESPSNTYMANVAGSGCLSPLAARLQFNRGVLQVAEAVDKVYCYVSTDNTNWSRLPPAPNTFFYPKHGMVDVTRDLRSVTPNYTQNGVTLGLECWAWKGSALVDLGQAKQTIGPAQFAGIIQVSNDKFKFVANLGSGLARSIFDTPQTRPTPEPPKSLPEYIFEPYGVADTGDTTVCAQHSDAVSALFIAPLCKAAVQNGLLILDWNWQSLDSYQDANNQVYRVIKDIDGFHVYENDARVHHQLIYTTKGGGENTLAILSVPSNPNMTAFPPCYVVRAYKGNLESTDSDNTFCLTDGLPGLQTAVQTVTLPAASLRTVDHGYTYQGFGPGCGAGGLGTGPLQVPAGQVVVGYVHQDGDCGHSASAFRGFVLFDLSGIGPVQSATLSYHVFDGVTGGGGLPPMEDQPSCATELLLQTTREWMTATDFVPGSYYHELHYQDLPVPSEVSPNQPVDFSVDVTSGILQMQQSIGNNGFQLRGANEDTGAEDNWVCQSNYGNFQLQVTYWRQSNIPPPSGGYH